MTWKVTQSNRFNRAYKRLNDALAREVDAAVLDIIQNPLIGEKKKGRLINIRVHKFRHKGMLYLIGYTKDSTIKIIFLEDIGPHEKFYRDLSR